MWKESKALVGTAAIMFVNLLVALVGLAIDPRMITGAPAWLKPAKFALSTAIFAVSIAWLFRYLTDFAKAKRWIGPALAVILCLEVGIIDMQAARGTTSHFNIGTPENAILFSIMGVAIGILWILSIWITMLLFRQTFKDRAWGWALRLGMSISVLGMAAGGLMTMPTAEQRAAMARDERVTVVGGHTVGAPDGGAGVPGVDWSKEHGDLRIPHFMGMHALQIIPLIVWWRRRSSLRFVFAIAGSYFLLYLILAWQALRGESIAAPTGLTLAVLGVWLAVTLGMVIPFEFGGRKMEAVHER
jgi:hypothetical protein